MFMSCYKKCMIKIFIGSMLILIMTGCMVQKKMQEKYISLSEVQTIIEKYDYILQKVTDNELLFIDDNATYNIYLENNICTLTYEYNWGHSYSHIYDIPNLYLLNDIFRLKYDENIPSDFIIDKFSMLEYDADSGYQKGNVKIIKNNVEDIYSIQF